MISTRPTRALAAGAALTLGLALASCADDAADNQADDAAGSEDGGTITLYAAASTSVLNDEITDRLAEEGLDVDIVNTGSSELVAQLEEGAPADVFVSADQRTMDRAVDSEVVQDPEELAHNEMVMVVPADNPADISSVEDLDEDTVLALCDEEVPCGNVSGQIQESLGLELQPDTLEPSVTDVLEKVASGEVDAGWVYRTDAASAGDQVQIIEIPGAEEHQNTLFGALTADPQNPEGAKALLDLLTGEESAEIWEEHGFLPTQD